MAEQGKYRGGQVRRLTTAMLVHGRAILRVASAELARLWPLIRLALHRLAQILLALILLFEEWGWRPLAALLGRLGRFPLIARLEAVIAGLPPYAALAVFAAPSALILPLKLLALYLIAGGHALAAALLFIAAKIVGTAIVARLFILTQPKLMQIGWFARAYGWLMPWKDQMFAAIRASWAWRYGRIIKYRVKQALLTRWRELRPAMLRLGERTLADMRRMAAKARGWLG